MKAKKPLLTILLTFLTLAAAQIARAQSTINLSPTSRTLLAGEDLLLQVEVSDADPESYQWSFNGVVLPAATSSTLSIPNAQPSDSGTCRVTVDLPGRKEMALARIQVDATSHSILPLELTGWNVDTIVEIGGTVASTTLFDTTSAAWFEAGYQGYPDGLPSSRTFTSASSSEVQYRLQPYDGDNVLWMTVPGEGAEQSATLTLAQPAPFTMLAIAAASSGGSQIGPGTVVLHFSDGTTSRAIPFDPPDWCGCWTRSDATMLRAIAGLGRWRSEDFYESADNFGFDLFETLIDLETEGLHTKTLTHVEFTMPNAWTAGIYAVSGKSAVDSPVELTTGFHVSWPSDVEGYVLEEAESPYGPWMPTQGAPIVVEGQNIVVMDLRKRLKFYRLTKAN